MAEDLVTSKDGVWRMDVDAFLPSPEGFIKIKGVEYPIYSFLDIEIGDSIKVARLSDDIQAAEGYDVRLERSIEQIMLLNKPGRPRLERSAFDGITPKQIITLTVLASSIAQVPLKAAAEESANPPSPSPLPASAGSTAGGAERSSSA